MQTAVEAMKHGAFHYANKPFDLDEVVLLVERRSRRHSFGAKCGRCGPARRIHTPPRDCRRERADRGGADHAAQDWRQPRINGFADRESGTGKDLAAKVIHYSSNRASSRS